MCFDLSLILLNLKWLKHIKDVVFPQSEPNVYFIFEVTEQSYAQCSLLTFHRPHLYVFIFASLISVFCKIVPASYSIMSQYQNQLIMNKQKKKNQHILKKIVTTKMNFYTQIQNIVSSLSSTRSIFYFISSHFLLLRESGKDSYSCAFVSQSLYWWDAFSEIIISSSTDRSTIQRRHWLIQLHIHMKATKVNTRKQSNSLTYKHADSSKTWSCPIFYHKSNTLTERKDKEAPPVGLWWKQTIFLLLIIFWIFI